MLNVVSKLFQFKPDYEIKPDLVRHVIVNFVIQHRCLTTKCIFEVLYLSGFFPVINLFAEYTVIIPTDK